MTNGLLKRGNQLIKAIDRTPFEGRGKPEPLHGDLSGFWSRRINEKERLIYTIDDTTIPIATCRSHYA
ncbi:Txe/YoeB family addiction module toxin [Levilactobacillus sp. HBUAS70063]|uniref:Txe/YoeB family addiction module toxin n=1 Tax=Levilactobacillus sp. HBUAS70063 TaxID=3109359 RepID=UPI003132DFF7